MKTHHFQEKPQQTDQSGSNPDWLIAYWQKENKPVYLPSPSPEPVVNTESKKGPRRLPPHKPNRHKLGEAKEVIEQIIEDMVANDISPTGSAILAVTRDFPVPTVYGVLRRWKEERNIADARTSKMKELEEPKPLAIGKDGHEPFVKDFIRALVADLKNDNALTEELHHTLATGIQDAAYWEEWLSHPNAPLMNETPAERSRRIQAKYVGQRLTDGHVPIDNTNFNYYG
ncbi:MAG: hypothetical protein ACRC9Y_09120 [Aeromonas veronii]